MDFNIASINSGKIGQKVFGGINRTNGTPLGYWKELCNMDMSEYPALKTCEPFCYEGLPEGITGYVYRGDKLIYTVSDGIYIDGVKTPLTLSAGKKQLVIMGAYAVVFPDCAKINITDTTDIVYQPNFSVTGTLTEANTNMFANIHKLLYINIPSDSEDLSKIKEGTSGIVSYSKNGKAMSLKVCVEKISDDESYTAGGCTSVIFETKNNFPDTTYFYTERCYITANRPYTGFSDAVFKSIGYGDTSADNGACADDGTGDTEEDIVTEEAIGVSIPDLDFIAEYNNRLWGCSSKNHEIYCSKLAEPLEWNSFAGISTDSWAATVGTQGDFTGVAVYNGSILFFKENCVHIVYGSKPSNFSISTVHLRGVQKGSDKSLCISDGLLYYKAPEGIFCFNGSSAYRIDEALGDDITETAVGTADDRYIIMLTGDTAYYFDKRKKAWYTRTLSGAVSAHSIDGKLYAVTKSGDVYRRIQLTALPGNTEQIYSATDFFAETGELGRGDIFRYFKKLRFVLSAKHLYPETNLNFGIYISCDGGEWQNVYDYKGADTKADENEIVIAPIIPVRCQRIRIRISGKTIAAQGCAVPYLTLYGIYADAEEGSEIGGKH